MVRFPASQRGRLISVVEVRDWRHCLWSCLAEGTWEPDSCSNRRWLRNPFRYHPWATSFGRNTIERYSRFGGIWLPKIPSAPVPGTALSKLYFVIPIYLFLNLLTNLQVTGITRFYTPSPLSYLQYLFLPSWFVSSISSNPHLRIFDPRPSFAASNHLTLAIPIHSRPHNHSSLSKAHSCVARSEALTHDWNKYCSTVIATAGVDGLIHSIDIPAPYQAYWSSSSVITFQFER